MTITIIIIMDQQMIQRAKTEKRKRRRAKNRELKQDEDQFVDIVMQQIQDFNVQHVMIRNIAARNASIYIGIIMRDTVDPHHHQLQMKQRMMRPISMKMMTLMMMRRG